jgi:hypothetical protein
MKLGLFGWSLAMCLAAGIAVAVAQPTTRPAPASPTPAAYELDRFINHVRPTCENAPAEMCVDAGFRFADINRDGRLSVEELQRVRNAFGDWMAWRGGTLTDEEQAQASFAVMIVDTLGIPAIVQSYDRDGDGQLTKQEALADVRLDRRPLAQVLSDPNNVDRVALQQRLGMMGGMAGNIFPQ